MWFPTVVYFDKHKHAFAGPNTQHPTNAFGTRNASEKNQIYQHFKLKLYHLSKLDKFTSIVFVVAPQTLKGWEVMI